MVHLCQKLLWKQFGPARVYPNRADPSRVCFKTNPLFQRSKPAHDGFRHGNDLNISYREIQGLRSGTWVSQLVWSVDRQICACIHSHRHPYIIARILTCISYGSIYTYLQVKNANTQYPIVSSTNYGSHFMQNSPPGHPCNAHGLWTKHSLCGKPRRMFKLRCNIYLWRVWPPPTVPCTWSRGI